MPLQRTALLLLVIFQSATAQALDYYADASMPNENLSCEYAYGGFVSFYDAVRCAQPGDNVYVMCADPSWPDYYEPLDPNYRCYIDQQVFTGKSNINIRYDTMVACYSGPDGSSVCDDAQPRPIVFVRNNKGNDDPVIKFEPSASGWTLDGRDWLNKLAHGFIIDGEAKQIFDSGDSTRVQALKLVEVKANNVTLRNVIVENGAGSSCLRVDNGGDSVTGFILEDSIVRDCIRWGQVRQFDTHGVHTCNASGMRIRRNLIERCSGDGVQLENYSALGCKYSNGNGQGWEDIQITQNTIRTNPVSSLGAVPGENGIDAKDGRGLLLIEGNSFSGFRGYDPIALGGVGTGSGSKGDAVLVHGNMLNCSTGFCVTIQNNNISNSNVGITVGVSPSAGGGGGNLRALVRRNYVHNLSPVTFDTEAVRRGAGIRIGAGTQFRVVHNTIANTPGLPFYQDDLAPADTQVSYNLVSYAGVGCAAKTSSPYEIFSSNLCFQGPGGARVTCNQTLATYPNFVMDDIAWRDSDGVCGASSTQSTDFMLADYRLTSSSSHVINQAASSTDSGPYVGTPDHGAHEYGL